MNDDEREALNEDEERALFTPDEEIERMAEAVLVECRKLSRGDLLAHAVIEEATGLVWATDSIKESDQYSYVINKVKNAYLDESGILLESDPRSGWKLLTQREQILEQPERAAQMAERKIARSERSVRAVPTEGLSLTLCDARAKKLEKLRKTRVAIQADLIDREVLARRTPVNPRRQPLLVGQDCNDID